MSLENREQIAELINLMREAMAAAATWKKLNKQLAARLQRSAKRPIFRVFACTLSGERPRRDWPRAMLAGRNWRHSSGMVPTQASAIIRLDGGSAAGRTRL